MALLSFFSHRRSVRPSSIILVYLLVSVAFESAQIRTLYLKDDGQLRASLLTAALGVKLVLLLVESKGKSRYLKPPYREYPPESLSGIISRTFFWWLNGLLRSGYSAVISFRELYNIDANLESRRLHEQLQNLWNQSKPPEAPLGIWSSHRESQAPSPLLPRQHNSTTLKEAPPTSYYSSPMFDRLQLRTAVFNQHRN